MPLYEYECTKCGKIFEDFTTLAKLDEKKKCSCGATCKRIVSATSFILKGSGWAKDGYSKDNK